MRLVLLWMLFFCSSVLGQSTRPATMPATKPSAKPIIANEAPLVPKFLNPNELPWLNDQIDRTALEILSIVTRGNDPSTTMARREVVAAEGSALLDQKLLDVRGLKGWLLCEVVDVTTPGGLDDPWEVRLRVETVISDERSPEVLARIREIRETAAKRVRVERELYNRSNNDRKRGHTAGPSKHRLESTINDINRRANEEIRDLLDKSRRSISHFVKIRDSREALIDLERGGIYSVGVAITPVRLRILYGSDEVERGFALMQDRGAYPYTHSIEFSGSIIR